MTLQQYEKCNYAVNEMRNHNVEIVENEEETADNGCKWHEGTCALLCSRTISTAGTAISSRYRLFVFWRALAYALNLPFDSDHIFVRCLPISICLFIFFFLLFIDSIFCGDNLIFRL